MLFNLNETCPQKVTVAVERDIKTLGSISQKDLTQT